MAKSYFLTEKMSKVKIKFKLLSKKQVNAHIINKHILRSQVLLWMKKNHPSVGLHVSFGGSMQTPSPACRRQHRQDNICQLEENILKLLYLWANIDTNPHEPKIHHNPV